MYWLLGSAKSPPGTSEARHAHRTCGDLAPRQRAAQSFYEAYFEMTAGTRYDNTKQPFESCFLSFASGERLELMRLPDLADANRSRNIIGLAHLALATGSREVADTLTRQLRADGRPVMDGPRTTAHGYYGAAVLDP